MRLIFFLLFMILGNIGVSQIHLKATKVKAIYHEEGNRSTITDVDLLIIYIIEKRLIIHDSVALTFDIQRPLTASEKTSSDDWEQFIVKDRHGKQCMLSFYVPASGIQNVSITYNNMTFIYRVMFVK